MKNDAKKPSLQETPVTKPARATAFIQDCFTPLAMMPALTDINTNELKEIKKK